jgi:hypothetical protein
MTAQEQESQTAELFHGALACAPDQRSAFLKEACGGDEAMRLKVEALLAVYNDVRTAAPAPSTPNHQTDEAPFDPDVLIAISERYEALRFIGFGGMGLVFRAFDRETGKLVALKVLRPAYAHDERFIDRFRNEVRLALDIAHRNVCRTYNLERVKETLFISMEYVEGPTLRNILDRVEGVSVRQGLRSLDIC